MPRTRISEYSTTNSDNTDIEGINIAENCPPSGINNAIREVMVHLKEFQTGASSDPLTVAGAFVASGGATLSGTNTFSGAMVLSGNINSSGTNTFSNNQVFSGNINSSGTNTFSGSQIITGNINSSGSANTFSGGVVHSGTNTFSSSVIFSGNINSSGTNTFSGTQVFSNNVTFSNPVIMSSTVNGTTIPTSKTLVDTNTAQTLTNKTISGSANTITNVSLTTGVTGTLPVTNGGSGQTTFSNGQLLIGNSTGNTLTKATLTAGPGIIITNGAGSITVEAEPAPVTESDVGTAPDQIPTNQFLGALAYEDTEFPALDVGAGITSGTGTICKANGGLAGGVYKVTVLVDITGLNSGGTAGDIIGANNTTSPCYIARLPSMTVLGGRMTCLEVPAGSDDDLDLYSATEGTGVEDGAISSLTETQLVDAGGAWTLGLVKYFAADPTANQYLYLVGQETGNATYTAGRFLIEIFGVQ